MRLPRCLLPLLLLVLQAGSVISSVGENRQPKSLRGSSSSSEAAESRTPSRPLQRQGSWSLIDSRVQQQQHQDQDDDYPRRRLEDRPSGGLNIPINTNQQTPGGIPENTNQQTPDSGNSNSNTESQNTAADFPSLGLTLDGREWVYCLMEFGFEPGFARDVTVEEIEELQCHINTYIADRVRMSLEAQNDNRPIRVKSRLINWEFTHQGDELPLTLTFFADTSYRDAEKENVHVDTVFYAFDLSPEEIANFIQNYMWLVNINNPFYYSMTVTLTVRQAEPLPRPQDLKIDQTFCEGETRFPSFTPSSLPSLQPTSMMPTKGTEAPTVGTLSPTVGATVAPTVGTMGPTVAAPTAGGTVAPTAGGTAAPTSASNNGPTANDAPSSNNNPTSTSAPTTSASNNNPTAAGSDNNNNGSPTINGGSPTALSPSSPNAGGTSMPSPATTATMSPTVTMNPTGTMAPTGQSTDGTTSPTTIDAANTGVPTSASDPTAPSSSNTQGPAGPPASSPTAGGGGALDGGVTEAPAASPTATNNDPGQPTTGTTTNSPTASSGDAPTATPLGGQQPSDATSPTASTATQTPTVGDGGGTSAPTAGSGGSTTTTAPSSPTDTPPGNLPVSGSSTNTGGDGTNEPSAAPSTIPTLFPTLAPTANPLVPVSYRMDFTWAEQSFQPKTAQIQQMLCETELFLQERLAVATTMPHVNARLSNIDWEHEALPEGGAVLAVNWTLTTTLEDDSSDNPLVPQSIVLAALEPDSKTNTSLYDYLLQTATADDESGSTGRRRIRKLRIRTRRLAQDEEDDVHEEIALENRNGNIFGSAVDNKQGGATGSVGSPFGYMSSLTLTDYPLDTELASPGQLESLVGVCNELSVRDPPESALGEPLPAELLDELNGGNGVNKPGDNDRETGDGNSPGSTPGGGGGPLAPTVAPGPSVRTVNVSFVVSNLDSITVPQEVNNSGLSVSFPAFAEQVVRRVKTEDGRRRYLRATTQRQLETTTVQLEPGTAYVSQLIRTNCGDNVDEKLICHEAMAQFDLRREVTDGDGSTNQRRRLQDWTHRYAVETYQGINDGTYYDIMKEKMPGTPLYIGTMVPGAPESSGVSYVVFWILIVLIILLVLCVILTCAYLCYERNQHDKELDDLYDELEKMEDWDEEDEKNAKPQHHHHHYPPEKANKDATGKGSDSDKRSTEEEEDDFLDEEEFMDISEISGKDGDDMGGFVDADDFDMFEDEAREVEQMEDAASDQSPIDAAKEGRALPMDGDDEAATRGIDQANNKEPPPDEIDSDEENVIHVGPQEFDASSLSEISARELEQSGSFSGSHSGSSSGSSGSSSGGSASCDVSVSSGSYDEDEDVDRHLEDSPKTRISVDSDHGGPVVFEDLDDTTEGDDDDLEASVTLQEIFNLSKPLGESGGDMSEKQARALPPTIEEQQEEDDQSAPSTPQTDGVEDAEEPPDPLDDLFSSSDSDEGTEGSYDDHVDVLPTHESESNNSERSAPSIGDGEPATRALNERASQDSDEESLGEEYGHGTEREPTDEDEACQSAHNVPSTAGSGEDKEPATRALPLNESDENSLENDRDDEGETTNEGDEEDQAARALAAAAAGTAAAVAVGAAVASRDSDEDSVDDEEDQVIVADLRALPVASDADDEQVQSIEPTTRSAGDNQSDDDSTEAEEDHVVVADLRELPIASDSDADDEHIQSARSVPSNPAEEDEAAARSLGDSSDDDSQEDLSGDVVLPNPSVPDVAGDEKIQSSRSIPTDTAGEDETAATRSLGDSSDDDSQEDLSGDRVLRNPARPDVADDEQIQSSRSIPTNTAGEDEAATTRSFGDISGSDSEEEPSPGDDNDHMSQSDEDEDDTSYPNVPPDADEVCTRATGDDDSLGDEEDHTARNLAVAAAGTAAVLAVGAAVASRDRDSDDDSLGDEEPVNGKEDSNNESDQEHTSRSIPAAAAEKAPSDLNSTGSNDSDEDSLETEKHPDDRLGATSSVDDDDESSPNTPTEAGTRAVSDHSSEEEDEDEEPSNEKVDATDRVEKEDYGPALQHLMSALGGNAQEDSDEDSLEAQESLSVPPVAASRAACGPDSKEDEDQTDDYVDPAYDDDDQEDHQTARSAPLSSNDDGNDRDDDDYQSARNGPLSSSALGDIALDDSDEDSLEGQLFGEAQSTNRDDAQDGEKEVEDDEPKEKNNSGDDSSSSSGDGSEDEGSIMSSSGWSSSGSHSSSDEEVEDEQQRENEGTSRSRGSTGSHSSNEADAEDGSPQDNNATARSIGNDSDGSLEDIIGESTEELQMEQENNTLALEHAQNSANLATMESSFSEIDFHERGGADKEDKLGQPDQDNDAMSTTSSLHESTGSMDGHIFEDNGSYDFENSVSLTDLFGLTKPSGEEKQAMSTIEEASVEDDQSARSTRSTRTLDDVANGVGEDEQQNGGKTRGLSIGSDEGKPVVFEDDKHTSAELERSMALQEVFNLTREEQRAHEKPPVVEQDTSPEESVSLDDVFGIPGGSGRGEKQAVSIPPPIEEASEEEERSVAGENVKSAADASGEVDFNEMTELDDSDEDEVPEWAKIDDEGEFFEESFEKESSDSDSSSSSSGSGDEEFEDFNGSGDDEEFEDFEEGSGGETTTHTGSKGLNGSGDSAKLKNSQGSNDSGELWEDFDGSGDNPEEKDSDRGDAEASPGSVEMKNSGDGSAEDWEDFEDGSGDHEEDQDSSGSSSHDSENGGEESEEHQESGGSAAMNESEEDWELHDESNGDSSKQNKSSGSLGDSGVDWEEYDTNQDAAAKDKSSGSLGSSGVDWEDYDEGGTNSKQNKSSGSLGDSGVDWEDYNASGDVAKQNKSSGSLGDSGVDWEDYSDDAAKQNKSSGSLGDSGVDWEDYDEDGTNSKQNKSSGSLGSSGVDWEDYDEGGTTVKQNNSSRSLGDSGVDWEDYDEGGDAAIKDKSSGSLGNSGVDWEDYDASSGDVAKDNKSSGSLGSSGVEWEDFDEGGGGGGDATNNKKNDMNGSGQWSGYNDAVQGLGRLSPHGGQVSEHIEFDYDSDDASDEEAKDDDSDSVRDAYSVDSDNEKAKDSMWESYYNDSDEIVYDDDNQEEDW